MRAASVLSCRHTRTRRLDLMRRISAWTLEEFIERTNLSLTVGLKLLSFLSRSQERHRCACTRFTRHALSASVCSIFCLAGQGCLRVLGGETRASPVLLRAAIAGASHGGPSTSQSCVDRTAQCALLIVLQASVEEAVNVEYSPFIPYALDGKKSITHTRFSAQVQPPTHTHMHAYSRRLANARAHTHTHTSASPAQSFVAST
jgi:hypothetical protein